MDRDYEKVREFVLCERRTGVAYLHQHLLLGKNKIERILSTLERDGVVSRIKPGGGREVLMPPPEPRLVEAVVDDVNVHFEIDKKICSRLVSADNQCCQNQIKWNAFEQGR